jgi:hypothetical protein
MEFTRHILAPDTTPPAQEIVCSTGLCHYKPAAPVHQTCNCRWDGEVQVQQCTLHQAHVDAIHEWAERAKAAEAKLVAQPVPVHDASKQFHEWAVAEHAAQAAQCKPLTDSVTLPLSVLEAAETSLGSFCSDHGWSDEDMQSMDNLSAYIARHKANLDITKGRS